MDFLDSDVKDFLDFDVKIGSGYGREYPVEVLRSPAGEPSGTMQFPFDTLSLDSQLKSVRLALRGAGGPRRDVATAEQVAVRDFGRQLFDALMSNRIRECFRRSRDRAKTEKKGLRVRLRIEPPELACLPWEFLYDADQGDYVCLSHDTPIVRYIELEQPPQALPVQPPLRILGMIASPSDQAALDVQRERDRIEKAVGPLCGAGLIELTWTKGEGWRDLQREMRQGAFHIFHFVGHGGFDANAREGLVALTDESGKTHQLVATSLGRLLADHSSLRLVVLNSCEGARGSDSDIFSSTASILIRRGVPAVVAMQYEISDAAAVEFARVLYEVLAEGRPIDLAVAEARKSISLSVNNSVEWGTPVLHMRSPDGFLFRIDRLTSTEVRNKAVHAAVADLAIRPNKVPDQALPHELLPQPQSNSVVEDDSGSTVSGDLQRPVIVFAPSLLTRWELMLAEGHWEGTIPCQDEVLLVGLRNVLREVLTKAATSAHCVTNVEVALTELCRNVARHAGTPIGNVTIDINYKHHSALISVSSEGPAFTLASALLKHEPPEGEKRTHVVHGFYNMLTRGHVKVEHWDGMNTVRFTCNVHPRRMEASDVMRFEFVHGDIVAGDMEFGGGTWYILLYGKLQPKPVTIPSGTHNFEDARMMLVRQWDAPLPVVLSIKYEPPPWTQDPAEDRTGYLFQLFVAALATDKRFRLLKGKGCDQLDIPSESQLRNAWRRILSRGLATLNGPRLWLLGRRLR